MDAAKRATIRIINQSLTTVTGSDGTKYRRGEYGITKMVIYAKVLLQARTFMGDLYEK